MNNGNYSPLRQLSEEWGTRIVFSAELKCKIAKRAYQAGIGVRGLYTLSSEAIDRHVWSRGINKEKMHLS